MYVNYMIENKYLFQIYAWNMHISWSFKKQHIITCTKTKFITTTNCVCQAILVKERY